MKNTKIHSSESVESSLIFSFFNKFVRRTLEELEKLMQKTKILGFLNLVFSMVPMVGLEPTRPNGQRILNPSCLPIPTHRQYCFIT